MCLGTRIESLGSLEADIFLKWEQKLDAILKIRDGRQRVLKTVNIGFRLHQVPKHPKMSSFANLQNCERNRKSPRIVNWIKESAVNLRESPSVLAHR